MSQFDRIEQNEIEKIAKKVVAASGGGGGGSGTVTQVNSGTGLTGGPITSTGTLSVSFGTSGTTACVGNDARLSDARTPTAHVHAAGDVTSGTLNIARIPTGTSGTTVCIGNDARLSDARTPLTHTHPQSDITNLVTDLAGKANTTHTHDAADIASGVIATARLASSGTASSTTFLRGDQRWATPASLGLADGDYGDVTVSGTGTVMTVDVRYRPWNVPLSTMRLTATWNGTALTNAAQTGSRIYLAPYVACDAFNAVSLVGNVVTGVASSTFYLGVYASGTNGWPSGAPLINSGSLSGAAGGDQTYTPGSSLAMAKGTQYWLAFMTGATAPNVRQMPVAGLWPFGGVVTNATTSRTVVFRTITPGTWPNFTTNPVVVADLASAAWPLVYLVV
jgi:hypothetical protein